MDSRRPLHLQTIDTLFSELIGGGSVSVGESDADFSLANTDSRAILNWYRLNRAKWAGNVLSADVESIVNSINTAVPTLSIPEIGSPGTKRFLRLAKLVAHRFGGIHAYGSAQNPPDDFVFEPREPITLFEGWNGAGKTSLLNAIVWCLTGEILRPQRPPESGQGEFDGLFVQKNGTTEETTSHRLTPITPLPDPNAYPPLPGKPIPVDSWVELTFIDQDGHALPPIRRTQVRNAKGKITESESGFSSLGVDPISLRIGTTMPASLAFLRIGSPSDLGTAAAKLTGLADISSLAKHATKTREKLNGEFRKDRDSEIEEADARFLQAHADLKKQIDEYPKMAPPILIPTPSGSKEIEGQLAAIEQHLNNLKAETLTAAQTILGTTFDPNDKSARDGLEQSIGPAQGQIKSLGQLTSARRLKALLEISQEDWDGVDAMLAQIRSEAEALAELAASPALGRRKQLYARVSGWIAEGGGHDFSSCEVCSRSLEGVVDPISQRAVSDHLSEVSEAEQALLALTQKKWTADWVGKLASKCPPTLAAEMQRDLPSRPVDLMRSTMVEELFDTEAFKTTLSRLKVGMSQLCDQQLETLPSFQEPFVSNLPSALATAAAPLMQVMVRLARARGFAQWRTANEREVIEAFKAILRGPENDKEDVVDISPIGKKLDALAAIVKGVAPLNAALEHCKRMNAQLGVRRAKEARLALYSKTATALEPVIELGSLAEAQVENLRKLLHVRASYWRSRCYANAYAIAGHGLRDTSMDVKGVLEILVGSERARAPAQHISNASALRASLMGFFLAFWEHVLKERGGIALLILDDPQELLDHDNRDRLAKLLPELVATGGQVIVATYDRYFAREAAAAGRSNTTIEHRSVHPVNLARSVLHTAAAVEELDRKRDAYEKDKDNAVLAQEYAGEVRVFIEARLADLFDDPAYPAYSAPSKAPTLSDYLNRLRALMRAAPNALLKSRAVREFAECKALAQGSACLTVLNTPHHDKASLSAGAVFAVATELDLVRRLAERMHSDFRLWRWREPLQQAANLSNVVPFKSVSVPTFSVLIQPDLAAFTSNAAHDVTQDVASELLTEAWFADKTLFYMRAENLGFALPAGCIAIVESSPYEGKDHNIVIARQNGNILARRLFRPRQGDQLALAAEAPDPRASKPTLVFDGNELAVHKVMGMLTERPSPPIGKGEAVEITSATSLSHIKTAYRVREESGIPLVLPGQVVLGGELVLASQLAALEGQLIALTLKSGSSLFKRVGQPVPGSSRRSWQFESVGGLGSSLVVSLDDDESLSDIEIFASARRVVGVLYAV